MSENKIATKADLQRMYNKILPYLGGMPEMVANKFSKGDLYSTEERMIGQWVDGKPLYQKTIVIANMSSVWSVDIASNVETLVDGGSIIRQSSLDTSNAFIAIDNGVANEDYLFYRIVNGVLKIAKRSSVYNIDNVIATVKYTKITDSPISIGSDTDYSTTEKIVGTWIDGKPIYQRYFSVSPIIPVVNSWVTLVTIPNIEILINARVFNIYDAGNLLINSDEIRVTKSTGVIEYQAIGKVREINGVLVKYTKTTD